MRKNGAVPICPGVVFEKVVVLPGRRRSRPSGLQERAGVLCCDALDKVDEALARERALSQLAHKIVLDVLLPDVCVGADERANERVRVTRRRAASSVRERLSPIFIGPCLCSARKRSVCMWFRGPWPLPMGNAVAIPWYVYIVASLTASTTTIRTHGGKKYQR